MNKSSPESLNLDTGAVIGGRFEIISNIGAGSMGVVYECKDRHFPKRKMAMKVLYPELARDDTGLARFQNEILAAHKVVHRNVVQPFDYVEDGNLKAYTMEYVQGIDLAKFIEREKPLSIGQVVDILAQMCQGVEAIHQAGIVHRDLKPENVMISESGDVKIMDFGIARAGAGRNITPRGSILGTFEYMSPEYLSDGIVHRYGDIYSLGVIAYEMLTGRLPHRGGSLVQIIQAKVRYQPQPPKEVRPDCPPVLNEMILKALSLEPTERFASAGEWGEQLLPLAPRTKAAKKSTLELARMAIDSSFAEFDKPKPPEPSEPPLPAIEDEVEEILAEEDSEPPEREPPKTPSQTMRQPELNQFAESYGEEDDEEAERYVRRPAFLLRFLALAAFLALLLGAAVFVFGHETILAEGEKAVKTVVSFVNRHWAQFQGDPRPTAEDPQAAGQEADPADPAAREFVCDIEALAEQVESKTVAELEVVGADGRTMLARAAARNCFAIVDMLITKGVNVNQQLPGGTTALVEAERAGAVESMKLLELAAEKGTSEG